jgi:hypothetical protein
MKQLQNPKAKAAQVEQAPPALDLQFTRSLLEQYQGDGPGAAYETIRLEGARLDQGGTPARDVHVYEMYWSDLSRLGAGWYRFLGELFELLFDISVIGRKTMDFSLTAYPSNTFWRFARHLQNWAVRSWSIAIPILNLLLLLTILVVLTANVLIAWHPAAVWFILGLFVFALLFWLNAQWDNKLFWNASPFLVLGVPAVLWRTFGSDLTNSTGIGYEHLLALEMLLVGGVGVGWIIWQYAKRRPNADRFGIIAGGTIAAIFVWQICLQENSKEGITNAGLHIAEILFMALSAFWSLTVLCMWLACLARTVGISSIEPSEQDNARKVAWTARLSLTVPTGVFLLLTLAFYGILYILARSVLPSMPYKPVFPILANSCSPTPGEFLFHLIELAATPLFIVALLLIGLSIFLTLWALSRAVWSEFVLQSRPEQRKVFGEWLTRGYTLMRWAGEFIFVAMFVVLPIGGMVMFLAQSTFKTLGSTAMLWSSLAAAPAIGVVALRGRLDSLTMGLRAVLGIALDIDSYLREHPKQHTPRARIFARYTSLLRYIRHWTHPQDGHGYDAVIIISHSQGTVITADLLRYLQSDPDPGLEGLGTSIPVYVLTVGSPLHQIYARRFPHLYRWVDPDSTSIKPPCEPALVIPDTLRPCPSELGIKLWMNAYGASDYIGRSLWRPETSPAIWESRLSKDTLGSRQEFCVGSGGHIHYLDGTFPEIGKQLDMVIRDA